MRLVVPYRRGHLCRDTYDVAVEYQGPTAFVRVRNDDEPADAQHGRFTYPELLDAIWRKGQSVMLLEHDVMPQNGAAALRALKNCPEPWCGYQYVNQSWSLGADYLAFGCVKISAEVIAATQGIYAPNAAPDWRSCDAHLWFAAHAKGFKPHHHKPEVSHHGWLPGDDRGVEYANISERGELLEPPRPSRPRKAYRRPLTSEEVAEQAFVAATCGVMTLKRVPTRGRAPNRPNSLLDALPVTRNR